MDKLNSVLVNEETLIPSSGFVAGVMQRVREEAAVPPPILFPWKRAIPAFLVAVIVFAVAGVQFAHALRAARFALTFPEFHLGTLGPLDAHEVGWLVVAVAVAAASWLFSRLLTRSAGLL